MLRALAFEELPPMLKLLSRQMLEVLQAECDDVADIEAANALAYVSIVLNFGPNLWAPSLNNYRHSYFIMLI